MKKIQEQLVSFEIAKLAKEKGFKIWCPVIFWLKHSKEGKSEKTHIAFDEDEDKWYEYNHNCGTDDEINESDFVFRPTQSLLQAWLREEHRIDVMPTMSRFSRTYGYKIFYIEDGKTEVIDSQYIKQSFNSAFESGLEEALKLI